MILKGYIQLDLLALNYAKSISNSEATIQLLLSNIAALHGISNPKDAMAALGSPSHRRCQLN